MSERIGRFIFFVAKPFVRLFISRKLRTRGLIIYKNEVLLLRNWIGLQKWVLPGGGLHRGETPNQGLSREIAEELDVSVDPGLLREILRTRQHEDTVVFPVVVFEVSLPQKEVFVVRRPEIIEAGWFDISQLPENLHPLVKEALGFRR